MRGRALLIGGSMSGLLAGLMLRERGWDVDVFERVESPLSGRGAGIVAQGELIAILKSLRLDTRELGVELTTRQILDASGGVAGRIECPQVLTAWERVFRVLRDAFPSAHYHRGIGLKGFEQNEAAVVAHLTDGRSLDGKLWSNGDQADRPIVLRRPR